MTERTPENWWDNLDTAREQPGSTPDPTHGLGGEAEPLPVDDAEHEEDMS